MVIKNIRPNFVLNIEKAYVEGIYGDSSLNRKMGRVGMSYKEYEKMIGGYNNKKKEKSDKNEIPTSLSDLNFNKEGIAEYDIGNKNIQIKLISHEKYGEKNFTLKINDKEIFNLNTTKLLRRMKALKDETFSESFDNEFISNKIPLTEEDFFKLYGNIGFNYTYYKDNLDIKVWIREDSDKKHPTFNIYTKDVETGKTKSFTKLSLIETHNKLLEYDLNPNIDKPLSAEQLKKLKEIQKKQGYTLQETKNDKISLLVKDLFTKEGKLKEGKSNHEINGLNISLLDSNPYIYITISDKDFPIKEKSFKINYTKEALSEVFEKANKEGKSMDLSREGDIKPSKDIGIKFDRYGKAFFKNGNLNTEFIISKENPSQIFFIESKSNELESFKILDISNIDNKFKNKLGTQVLTNNHYLKNSIPIKNILKDQPIDKYVIRLLSKIADSPKYNITKEDEDSLKAETARKYLNYNPAKQSKDWSKSIREAYIFINSKKFVNWVDDLPTPKEKTKKEMYYDIKNLSKRFSASGAYKGEFRDVDSIYNVKNYIIDKYY